MSVWKYLGPGLLLTAAGVGFYIASKKTAPAATVAGIRYYAKSYLDQSDQWLAQVFANGKPTGPTIGPLPTMDLAEEQAAAYIAGLDAVAFYTLHEVEESPGAYVWFFDGWSRGVKTSPDNGPFVSDAVARRSAAAWVGREIAGAQVAV